MKRSGTISTYQLCLVAMAVAVNIAGGQIALLLRLPVLSLLGVCMGGAAAHNVGQIAAAVAVLGTPAPVAYLPPLLLASLVTGAVTGGASTLLVQRVPDLTER